MPARSDIPPEILSSILDEIPDFSLLPLRTVSKIFLHLINQKIFSNINMHLSFLTYAYLFDNPPLMLIKSITTPSSSVSSIFNAVRDITLYAHSNLWDDENYILVDGKTPRAFFSDHLVPFLARLLNLESIDWTFYVDQKPSLQFATIAQSLSCLTKLQNVAITIHTLGLYPLPPGNYKLPPLDTFKNLASLSVSYDDDLPEAYCNREIAQVVAASPKLIRLSIINRINADDTLSITEGCTSLQTLFQNVTSPQLAQLELRYVSLSAADLNQTLLHKLKYLTISTPIGSRHLKFAWAELFTTLEEMGVKLSQLSVSGMETAVEEMFSYLISYVGELQTLEIRNIMIDCQDQEDKAGYRFWHEIVPHHQSSLKVLRIYPWFEGEWCYGPEAAAALSQCLSLLNLSIAGRSIGSAWAEAKLSLPRTNKVITPCDVREPYDHPGNSAALVLTDVSSSLEELTIVDTEKDSTRVDIINNLNRNIRPKQTPLSGKTYSELGTKWCSADRNKSPYL